MCVENILVSIPVSIVSIPVSIPVSILNKLINNLIYKWLSSRGPVHIPAGFFHHLHPAPLHHFASFINRVIESLQTLEASVSYFLPQFVVRVLLSLGNKIIEQEDTDGELEATVGEMTQSENREDTVGEQNKIEEHDYLGEQESTAGCSSTVSVERSVPRDSGRIRPDLVVVEDIIADTEEEYMDVTPIEKETDIGTLTLCKDDKDVSQLQCLAAGHIPARVLLVSLLD